MGELEERLDAVLSDPAQMERIAQMASRLMGSIAPAEADSRPAAAPASDGGALMGLVGRVMGGLQGDGRKKQLLQGLTPYLSESRSARLGKALRLAAAARLAGAAFSEIGGERDESV